MGLDVVYPCLAQATSAWPEPGSPEKCQAQASPFSRSGQVFLSFVWAFQSLIRANQSLNYKHYFSAEPNWTSLIQSFNLSQTQILKPKAQTCLEAGRAVLGQGWLPHEAGEETFFLFL